jgi:capsular exopolysaccharide synthesis family protein
MNEKINLTVKISEPVEEAIRTLRTNIQFCNTDRTIKTICLTSCIPNEGKSVTTLNLAISMAGAGKKVLHIDADMRKPRQYKDVKIKFNAGLSNYLSGMAECDDIISETNIENLHFVLCGPKPPNPAELLGTARFVELLDTMKEKYDYIIIDTPPLGSMIDAAIIASRADGTILLIAYKTVDYKKEKKVKEQLEKANANIIGVVLNKVPRKANSDYYYYKYYKNYSRRQNKKNETVF